jgi:hypothetical protein
MGERWARKCAECGAIDEADAFASKAVADANASPGLTGKLKGLRPRCPECGSPTLSGVLVNAAA